MGFLVEAVVIGIVAVGLVAWLAGVYNALVQLRNNIDKAWSNIDVLLQQRHDELTKLVDAVRGYIQHERELLETITRLRSRYDDALDDDEKVRVENELNQQLARLRVTLEGYPDLKANESVMKLQERISALESQIADRRELFNDSVNLYNISIERFPDLFLARLFGYERRDLLKVPEELRQDVKINLG